MDLCAVCAGLPATSGMLGLLAGMLGAAAADEYGAEHGLRCEACGLSFAAFAQTQLLGCAQCYRAFAERLEPLLAQIQAGRSHSGKIPARGGLRLRRSRDAARLRAQLDAAVANEHYERAAALRDRLRLLDLQQRSEA
ncbi:hypothetical protein EPN42_05535 [bacterium]|nr:MAG: hypothetical protein EPN42_05535 [bacterium]